MTALTETTDFAPIVVELRGPPDPVEVFRRLAPRPFCLFLDSALDDAKLGRYSFVTADPFETMLLGKHDAAPLECLSQSLAKYAADRIAGLPPFQGGAAGLFSYDLCHELERLPRCRFDEFGMPRLAVGLYDVVVAFDHEQDRAWIVSQGFPEIEPSRRRDRAAWRAEEFGSWIKSSVPARPRARKTAQDVPAEKLAPQFKARGHENLTSDFGHDAYQRAVGRIIEYVHAGDIFQANLSQRLLHPMTDDSVELYLRLRQRNPATFAGFLDLGAFQIVSASPERFLQVDQRRVEARPIKGTRQRLERPEADLYAADGLKQSEKDRAENVMIVDLLRNDLSKVCSPDSVQVTQLCGLERYAFVQHLVSVIEGRLRDEFGPLDLLRAAFPGGSITGAPKVRAMEIIAEQEPTARGPYCGSLGYVGYDGTMDASILIRTIIAGRGWWQLPVGGGIVSQSDPHDEYEETWHKAEGMLRALR